MVRPVVRRAEREDVTLLIGGLTAAQDLLLEAAVAGVGYRVEHLPVPDYAALQTGKELGNRAQCNPTYFTVGNLVCYLEAKREREGLSNEELVRRYVFLTAGACGPCRFGMYATEYRKALREAGLDGFRVMLFQQKGGLSQATGDENDGLELRVPFFLAVLKALIAGDVLNALAYRIRPYERVPGATDEALEGAKRILYRALRARTGLTRALLGARRRFAAVEVDRLRPKPLVSVIGEFWAMTTEGDGNYRLQRFLEAEGAENDSQLLTSWLLYNIWEVGFDTRARAELGTPDAGRRGLAGLDGLAVAKRLALMRAADLALRGAFQAMAHLVGLTGYELPDMNELAAIAAPHYPNELRGGEGHLEVAKLLVNATHGKAHMTVSVKPFGCLPSSGVSDGVQSLVTARHPKALFLAVETSGDGQANFHSRVQMVLYKARLVAERELATALEDTRVSLDEVRTFLARNPRHRGALHRSPHAVAGTAANLVYEVAPLITTRRAQRAWAAAGQVLDETLTFLGSLPEKARRARAALTAPRTWERVREDVLILREALAARRRRSKVPDAGGSQIRG